jgi:hypothetical protein
MAVQSSPSQQPLEDHLRMGQNVNTENLSRPDPNILEKIDDKNQIISTIFEI